MKPKYHRNSWLSRGKQTENGTTCDYSSVVTCVAGFYDRTDYRTKVLTKIDRKDRTIRPESWQYFFPASRTFILSWKNVVRDRRNFAFDIYRPVFFFSFFLFFLFTKKNCIFLDDVLFPPLRFLKNETKKETILQIFIDFQEKSYQDTKYICKNKYLEDFLNLKKKIN